MYTTSGDHPPIRLRTTPSWLISHTATHALRLVGDGFAALGARRYHYALLAALAEFGPASQASLGRRCGVDGSDVVAAVNELVTAGLVVRAPDPADRRRNIITLTEEGVTRLRKFDISAAHAQEELLAPLSAAERAQLTLLLGRLVDHHERPCG